MRWAQSELEVVGTDCWNMYHVPCTMYHVLQGTIYEAFMKHL